MPYNVDRNITNLRHRKLSEAELAGQLFLATPMCECVKATSSAP